MSDEIAAALPAPLRRELAASAFLVAVRNEFQKHKLAVEKLAMGKTPHNRYGKLDPQREMSHGWETTFKRGCDCEECTTAHHRHMLSEARKTAALSKVVAEFAAQVRVEWTAELLATSFAPTKDLPPVTWGAAVRSDHAVRVEAQNLRVESMLENVAMHARAIALLDETGASCLDDALATVSA